MGWVKQLKTLAVLMLLISTAPRLKVQAEESLGVSGSFAGMEFRMTPGETMDYPTVDVIFFNTSSTALPISLAANAPFGVDFHFDKTQVTIPPQSSIRVPVVFDCRKDLAEGSYVISVTATIRSGSGISINGFATLKARLIVMGEAGKVSIQSVDVRGKHLTTQLSLERITETGQSVVVDRSETGTLNGIWVPGTYRVTASLFGVDLASKTFELKDQDDLKIILTVPTIVFESFVIGPSFDDQNKITSVSVRSTFNNLLSPQPKVSVVLTLMKDGQTIESIQAMTLESLENGTTSINFNVVPNQGWQNGTYAFVLNLVSVDGIPLAQSPSRSVLVKIKGPFAVQGWGGWGLALVLLLLFIGKKSRSK